jgi:NADH:ubiquinone oxidoreductase subunit F (NADH-binding)/NADH:ubiquinone oxidoreductase subunit E
MGNQLDDLLSRYNRDDRGALVEALRQIQEGSPYITPAAIKQISRHIRVSEGDIFGVASFYSLLRMKERGTHLVHICDSPTCHVCGKPEIYATLCQVLGITPGQTSADGLFTLEATSCVGQCDRAPVMLVDGVVYGDLTSEKVQAVVEGYRRGEPPAAEYVAPEPLAVETRRLLENVGRIVPDSLDDALDCGAYAGLKKALSEMQPAGVIEEVTASGLRGRGGAGFPTGRKWSYVAASSYTPRYVVCNADESEPGTFKDRVLMEGDPHRLLEGIALIGYAVGAEEGYIYVRGEYPIAAKRLERAVEEATERGFLGENICGYGFNFHIYVHMGAGAYICGEETALLESLEGYRGSPRVRPPYPTVSGYLGQPTVINNVETCGNVPLIVRHGAAWYREFGTEQSPGTKIYPISGHVRRPGVVEAPLGVTVRQLIDEFAGGMGDGRPLKLVQTGGAAGTVIGPDLLDVPLDYGSAREGVALGSGALMVCDDRVCAVDLARALINFFLFESCGKCTPCREGTIQARRILNRLIEGDGSEDDLRTLGKLADVMLATSFCGLGQSVRTPLNSLLSHFDEEFRAHVQGRCPAGVCAHL